MRILLSTYILGFCGFALVAIGPLVNEDNPGGKLIWNKSTRRDSADYLLIAVTWPIFILALLVKRLVEAYVRMMKSPDN
jgi:hypothetical protein